MESKRRAKGNREPPKCSISFLSGGIFRAAPAPRPEKRGDGSCAGFRRLLANEVFETCVGKLQGSGVAFRALFCPPQLIVQVNSCIKCKLFLD